MKEVWKDVKCYEGYYEVSNLGNIKTLNINTKSKNGLIKLYKNKLGYCLVCLTKNGQRKTHFVHRLVAQAFIQNENNFPCVNHKDENPSNNFIFVNDDGTVDTEKSNLEWCTQKYNINYGNAQRKRIKNRKLKHKKMISDITEMCRKSIKQDTKPKVYQFSTDGFLLNVFLTVTEAWKKVGGSRTSIHDCISGKTVTSGGYIWIKK